MVVDNGKKQNRLYILKGGSAFVTAEDIYKAEEDFKDCDVVIAQFENDISAVVACKELAKKYNKKFILNPAPCSMVDNDFWKDIDFVTPNEIEAEFYTGVKLSDMDKTREAAKVLINKG